MAVDPPRFSARRSHSPCALLGALALGLTACASGKSVSDAGPDNGIDASTLGELGAPCQFPQDCQSGLCIDTGAGLVCVQACQPDCPPGFSCDTIMDAAMGGVDVCVPAMAFLCRTCTGDEDCGSANRCLELPGGMFCSIDCQEGGDDCPTGFSCREVTDGSTSFGFQCQSDNGVCCIDADGDFRGFGDDCRAGDCDDDNADIYDDALETCDGLDNDCQGGIDVDVIDCGPPRCRLGDNGYYQNPPEECVSGACEPAPEVSCGLYACSGGGENGDECATSCNGEDNARCGVDAHCEAGTCVADLPDGDQCNEDSDCASDHCQGGFCCAFGDCCQLASDCPTYGTFEPVCENPSTCQGSRGEAVCTVDSICGTTGDVADDSACSPSTVANQCGFFLPIFCTGELEQTAPSCPTVCGSNAACDPGAFCLSGDCVEDLDDGEECTSAAQCKSGHCQNGFCCDSGDCCQGASDCPPKYSDDPVCTTPSSCQGSRDAAECVDAMCGTAANTPDDSACTTGVLADDCGPYPALYCTGGVSQTDPVCDDGCATDSECDNDAYCNMQGDCEYDEPNGGACSRDSQCQSGHCQNGFCCQTGNCCFDNGDCDILDEPADCRSQSTCQGNRVEGVCQQASKQCTATVVNDDSACAGLQSNDCGPYPAIHCTSQVNQPSNQASLCSSSCQNEDSCDPSAHCDGGSCVPDMGQGGFCDDQADCGTGLTCVDNVCCGSSCPGSCRACDLTGDEGTCTLVPNGDDPDDECPEIDCDAYMWGWLGNTCYRKADVGSGSATCGGDGACLSTAEECAAQTARGGGVVTCDSTCQQVVQSSCTGTTPGQCTNLDLGTETCGEGVCEVTVDRCVNGSPQDCVPNSGASTSETCDGQDNDCNGSVDDGLPTDAYEGNNTCAGNYYLGTLVEGNTATYTNMTLYTSGDEDWYRQLTSELFTGCDPDLGEDYLYQVLMTPPNGKDYDLKVCYNSYSNSACTTDCFYSVLGGDQQEEITLSWHGPCGGSNDGLNFFIRVYPFAGASTCEPYTLTTTFVKDQ